MSRDWVNLGVNYHPTPWRFQAVWEDGAWSEGELVAEATITLSEGSTAIHYGQQCFEGLKAHAGPDGEAYLFRPEQNAARMARTAERLLIPPPPTELFLRGVEATVAANPEALPPHGCGAALYLRPLLIGVGDNLGLRPAPRFIFRVFCSPVGPYFKAGLKPIRLAVSPFDRVAARGTGSFKAGGNYAGGLYASRQAKQLGCDEALYLDPDTRTFLDEAGSANVFGILPGSDGAPDRLVTPASASILPSITMDALCTLAKEELGLSVERRPLPLSELAQLRELACAGTAAVVTPVSAVRLEDGTEIALPQPVGETTQRLHEVLTAVQTGLMEDRWSWRHLVAAAPASAD
ncbi:MAG: branched-chain amino acid aminotransferase [Planctomycetes bacterium]|nr:branched-chain amino acid aminotransferase [Planctomycetota bacterium]